jgi:hypothetical protein
MAADDIDTDFAGHLRNALDAQVDDAAAMRMEQALTTALHPQPAPAPDIMTLPELAGYLRVSAELVTDMLTELPCFELGGRLLFRRSAIDTWIAGREQRFRYELLEFDVRRDVAPGLAPSAHKTTAEPVELGEI